VIDIPDPRVFPDHIDATQAPLLELAQASLVAPTRIRSEEIDRALVTALVERLRSGRGQQLAELVASAPSVALARHLWRRLIEAWREASLPGDGAGIAGTVFALPLVIVAGCHAGETRGGSELTIAGVIAESPLLAAVLRAHGALAGNQAFGLSSALASADALDVERLPDLLAWQRLAAGETVIGLDLPPTPIAVLSDHEGVHLRFLVGTALAVPGTDLLADTDTSRWALPLASEIARQLAVPGISALALPGPPQAPLSALQHGRAAQREVGAQLFVGNALRRLRAAVGEPIAIVSAHRCPAAPSGGELRVSLSSTFDARQAEGFRCPLFPTDRASDVAVMLTELLHDCRVADVRVLTGVHGDRDPATGAPLLFKPDAIPEGVLTLLH